MDKVVGAAERHGESQDYVRPELARRGTLTGLQPPPLPPELRRTERAPSTTAPTLRATPPTGTKVQRPDDPASGQLDASAELTAARLRIAQLERDARAEADARNVAGTFPPPVSARKPSPVPSSSPEGKVDQAIGKGVRLLLGKQALALLAAAGIGGGVTAVAKPSADPAKADAVLASQEAMRADVALLREQMAGMIKREAARDQYTECLEEVLDDVGTQVLPAQDRLGAAAPLRAYIKQRCRRLRP